MEPFHYVLVLNYFEYQKLFEENNILNEINKLKTEIKTNSNLNINNSKSKSRLNELKLFLELDCELPQYINPIIDAGFENIKSLKDLTNDDWKEIDVKLAHRKIIVKKITQRFPKNH